MGRERTFTPGPWFADLHNERRDGGRFYVFITASGLVPVCAVTSGVEGYGRDEGRANATLLAAAPDLYEALAGCIEHLEWSTPQGGQAHVDAQAALAKAQGK